HGNPKHSSLSSVVARLGLVRRCKSCARHSIRKQIELMTRTSITLPLLLCLTSTFAFSQGAGAKPGPMSHEEDEKGIKQTWRGCVDTWNRHDANAFSMLKLKIHNLRLGCRRGRLLTNCFAFYVFQQRRRGTVREIPQSLAYEVESPVGFV